jgi:RalA-binding protein 1
MTMRNVGIVFSPTLGIPAGVFSLMLGEFNRVFNVDGETIDGGGVDGPSDLCRRNSRRYSEAAADELLGLSGRTLKGLVLRTFRWITSDQESITAVNDDSQSEGDDVLQDGESEATDGDMTLETPLSNTSPHAEPSFDTAPETPTKLKVSKASHAANSRGLSVNTSQSERDIRRSRMVGLPASPRPPQSPHQNGDISHPRKGSSA